MWESRIKVSISDNNIAHWEIWEKHKNNSNFYFFKKFDFYEENERLACLSEVFFGFILFFVNECFA